MAVLGITGLPNEALLCVITFLTGEGSSRIHSPMDTLEYLVDAQRQLILYTYGVALALRNDTSGVSGRVRACHLHSADSYLGIQPQGLSILDRFGSEYRLLRIPVLSRTDLLHVLAVKKSLAQWVPAYIWATMDRQINESWEKHSFFRHAYFHARVQLLQSFQICTLAKGFRTLYSQHRARNKQGYLAVWISTRQGTDPHSLACPRDMGIRLPVDNLGAFELAK